MCVASRFWRAIVFLGNSHYSPVLMLLCPIGSKGKRVRGKKTVVRRRNNSRPRQRTLGGYADICYELPSAAV